MDTSAHNTSYSSPRSSFDAFGSSIGAGQPLTLEACLFDNLPSSSSCLLGRGTLPLTPVIMAEHRSADPDNPTTRATADSFSGRGTPDETDLKQVVLLDPASGRRIASVSLGLSFSHRRMPESGAPSGWRVPVDEGCGVVGKNGGRAEEVSVSSKGLTMVSYARERAHSGQEV